MSRRLFLVEEHWGIDNMNAKVVVCKSLNNEPVPTYLKNISRTGMSA